MRSAIWVTCSALSAASLSSGALAQDAAAIKGRETASASAAGASAAGANQTVGEVVVTAQKRAQRLQDVGIAISAYSGAQLAKLGVKDTRDIVKLVPGLNLVGSFGGQKLSFAIRGVTEFDFSDHVEAPNAVYIDEGYVASQQGQSFALFDTDRIEVLKGPQSTLFGRNATGGAVSIFSRPPTPTLAGYLESDFGSYDQYRVEGAAGGPITEALSARLSGLFDTNGAYFHNLNPGQASEGNQTTGAGRLRLRYDVSNDLKFDVIAFGGKTIESTSPYLEVPTIAQVDAAGNIINSFNVSPTETRQAIGPGGVNTVIDAFAPSIRPKPGGDYYGWVANPNSLDYQKALTSKNYNQVIADGLNAKVEYNYNDITIADIFAYRHDHSRLGLTFDASTVSNFNSTTIADVDQYSNELRVNGGTGPLKWIAGFYFLRIDEATPEGGFVFVPLSTEFRDSVAQTSDSYAAYAQAEYKFADHFKFIAGFRVSDEDKKYHYETNLYNSTNMFTDTSKTPFIAQFRSYNGTLSEVLYAGKAQLEWQPNRDLLVFAGYSRGVKAGGFSAPLGGSAFDFVPDSALKYRPETLNDYEGGFKSTFLDGRLRFNGDAYYYDYRDYQALKVVAITDSTINANATTEGAELEVSSVLKSGLSFSLNGSYTDMVVRDVSIDNVIRDRWNPNTPKYQSAFVVGYERPMGGGLASVQVSGKYSSSMFYSLSNFESTKVAPTFSGDVRVSYQFKNWEASLAVQNFTDVHRPTIGYDLSSLGGANLVGYGKPRWVTGSLKYTF